MIVHRLPRVTAPAVAAALALTATVALPERASAAPAAPPPRTYTVRGEVARPPEPAARAVWIRHEAVPDFVDSTGKASGMQSMMMRFDTAPGVPLDTLKVGDKVEFSLFVGWSPPAMRIDKLAKLPADTPLRLGPAR